MRFHEIRSGIRIPLSQEESRLVEEIEESGSVTRTTLEEREPRDAELARKLCSRGVLDMIESEDEEITYKVSRLDDIWRD